jgi:phasin protein
MTDVTYPAALTWMTQATDGWQACFEACTGWQQELARFADQRMAGNRHTWEALLSSRDLAGLLEVQQSWARQAATDYTQEATRLARLFTSLSLTGTTPAVQESAALVA